MCQGYNFVIKKNLMCVITVKLPVVYFVIDNTPSVIMFWDVQVGQERFYDFDGVTDEYCKFIQPLGPGGIVVFKNEDHTP